MCRSTSKLSLLSPIRLCSSQCHTDLITVLKSGGVTLPTLFFFQIVLAILGLLLLHINFRISLTVSTKKHAGISMKIALTNDQFGEGGHLNNFECARP